MTSRARTVVVAAVVAVLGTAALAWGTDDFRAYTAETARRLEVLRSPRPLPEILLEDQGGKTFTLAEYHGRPVAVEFMYTNCPTVCRALGMAFAQIRDHLRREAPERDFALVSISFDLDRDDMAHLRKYASAYHADGVQWRIARVRDRSGLRPLLDAFGVVAIPDGFGGFEHNAAIHLIDASGRLTQIVDMEQASDVARMIAKGP